MATIICIESDINNNDARTIQEVVTKMKSILGYGGFQQQNAQHFVHRYKHMNSQNDH